MGWYADSEYSLTFRTRDDLARAAAHLRTTAAEVVKQRDDNQLVQYGQITIMAGWVDNVDDIALVKEALAEFGEEGDVQVMELPDGSVTFSGWNGGKGYPGPIDEPHFEQRTVADGSTYLSFNNGMGLGTALGYAHGTMDWVGESHDHWRWRFHGDGTYSEHAGTVVYRGDVEPTAEGTSAGEDDAEGKKCASCNGDISEYAAEFTLCVWCSGESDD